MVHNTFTVQRLHCILQNYLHCVVCAKTGQFKFIEPNEKEIFKYNKLIKKCGKGNKIKIATNKVIPLFHLKKY